MAKDESNIFFKEKVMLIRAMTATDVDEVFDIEQESFSDPWSKEAFSKAISDQNNSYLVTLKDGILVGYCGYWGVVGEGYIYNVAVRDKYRGQGIGLRMLEELVAEAAGRGITSLTLEVRRSNEPAIQLYKKLGFIEAGVRKNFYTMPLEDAIIMWRRPTIH